MQQKVYGGVHYKVIKATPTFFTDVFLVFTDRCYLPAE